MEIKSIVNVVRTKSGALLYTVILKDGKTVLLSSLENFKEGDKIQTFTAGEAQKRDGVDVPMFIMCFKDANVTTVAYQDKKQDNATNTEVYAVLSVVKLVSVSGLTEAQQSAALDLYAKLKVKA